ncbi:MAG TPA: hypothetical protein VJZ27_15675, partial [Aggregatilineales bacterium]|nr:hypothetical protein [Aggregatilineales bacterium]
MNNILKQITSLSLIAMLLFGVNFAAAQGDDEIDTSAWIVYQGEKSYVLAPDGWLNLVDIVRLGTSVDESGIDSAELAYMRPIIEAGVVDIAIADRVTEMTLNVIIVDLGRTITLEELIDPISERYGGVGG